MALDPDLSAQVLPGSGFVFIGPIVISDTGVITANGMLESGDFRAVILQPQTGATAPGEAQIVATQNQSAAATRHWSNSNTAPT